MNEFSLSQKNILNKLKDCDFFVDCIRYNYAQIASNLGFNISTDNFLLIETHGFWTGDLERVLNHGIDNSENLDFYKQVGFLAYWLRRRAVIGFRELNDSENFSDPIKLKDHINTLPSRMNFYARYYNEYSAFIFGTQLCMNYWINRLRKNPEYSEEQIKVYIENTARKIKVFSNDASVLLKHKSVSPHALYLIYKALFLD